MRSTRLTVERLAIGAEAVEADDISYADVFVVVRGDATAPAATDWEVTVRTRHDVAIAPGRHEVVLQGVGGEVLRGAAVVRFTDGRRHLLRGDDPLEGFVDSGPTTGA